jgi:1,4-alpha-glucan branching enzyme
MLKKEYPKKNPVCKVTFTLPDAIQATSAYLVGDFNNWSQNCTPMKKLSDGHFSATVVLEKGRDYQFRYLVNGCQWHNDWDADKYVANGIGGDNSVVTT